MMQSKAGARRKHDYERIEMMLRDGSPPRDVASALGCTRDVVYYVAQRIRESSREPYGFRYSNTANALTAVIDKYNAVTIEQSADGEGYIATLDDLHTGPQQVTPMDAVRAAIVAAERGN